MEVAKFICVLPRNLLNRLMEVISEEFKGKVSLHYDDLEITKPGDEIRKFVATGDLTVKIREFDC